MVPGKRAKQGASNNPPTAEHNIASALQEMIENSIESLQSSIKGVFVGGMFNIQGLGVSLKENMQKHLENTTQSPEEVKRICNQMLGLDFDASTSIEDVVKCCFLFRAAAEVVASMTIDNKDRTIDVRVKQTPFYRTYIQPVVLRAWKLVLEKHHDRHIVSAELEETFGMYLFRFQNPRIDEPSSASASRVLKAEPFVYKNFQAIFEELDCFFLHLLAIGHQEPTVKALNKYLSQKEDKQRQVSSKPPPIETIISIEEDELDLLRRRYEEGKISGENYVKRLLKALGGDNIDVDKLLRFPDGQALDFETLLTQLEINNEEKMDSHDTHNQFFNSFLSSAFIFVRVIR